jgi:hypothetical protein
MRALCFVVEFTMITTMDHISDYHKLPRWMTNGPCTERGAWGLKSRDDLCEIEAEWTLIVMELAGDSFCG